MKKIALLCCLLGALVCFSGCSKSNDEDNDELLVTGMVKTDYIPIINGEKQDLFLYNVPATGGTYILTFTKNDEKIRYRYPFWIEEGNENERSNHLVWGRFESEEDLPSYYENVSAINLREKHLVGDWYDVFFEEGKGIIVKISPNETGIERWILFEFDGGMMQTQPYFRQTSK